MKKLENCVVENCIPTPSSCVTWNGGTISYLGICNEDNLNNIVWEIVSKLQAIAGEDLGSFDIDSLLDICDQKAPLETNLRSILVLLRDNQVCLKDYIDTLDERVTELGKAKGVSVNLRCYADFDNLGNALSIDREQLDQLVIDQLCDHKQRLTSIEGKYTNLKIQVDNINPKAVVEELSFATCIDPAVKPTSVQTKSIATELCNIRTANGNASDIAGALSKTPSNFNTKFSTLQGWDLTPDNWAQHYGNLLLAFNNVVARLEQIENTCCATTCDDVKLGFSAVMNEEGDGVIIRFTYGSGTVIPAGFVDKGSTGTITDKNGNVETFNLVINNNSESEVYAGSLDLSDRIEININAKIGNDALLCDKCISKSVLITGGNCCVFTNDTDEDITLIYEIPITTIT